MRTRVALAAGLATAAAAAAVALLGPGLPAQAQTPTPAPTPTSGTPAPTPTPTAGSGATQRQPTLVVTGEGTAYARPDTAYVTLGVAVTRSTAAEALREGNRVMNDVIAALKAQGARDEDIQTTGLSLFPVTAPPRQGEDQPPTITGYRATDNVTVTLPGAERAGAAIDAAVAAGANMVGGVRFALRDSRALQSQAAAAAVTDGRAHAESLAQALGVRLGPIVEAVYQPTGEPGIMRQGGGLGAAGDATPIQPGQVGVTVRVQITYALG